MAETIPPLKPNKGGRPPKDAREKKGCKIEMKLTQADYDRLEKLYGQSGYRNKSDMFYDLVFHQTIRQKDSATLLALKEIQEVTREIKSIGALYHEAVQHLQAGGPTPTALRPLVQLTEKLRDQEQELFRIIIQLREKWLRAL